jgi:Holliday junction resolvasome RuvABC ATP-dependent DNA helicase subunit
MFTVVQHISQAVFIDEAHALQDSINEMLKESLKVCSITRVSEVCGAVYTGVPGEK